MLYGIRLGIIICNKLLGEPCAFSHKKFLDSDFLLTFLGKQLVKKISPEDTKISELVQITACNNSSKYWRLPMKKKLFFFLAKSEENLVSIFFVGN